MSIRRLTRGEARPSDLSAALDDLGVEEGQQFLVAALERSIDEAAVAADPRVNLVGGFAGESDTSREAALYHFPRSGALRGKVLHRVGEHHPTGVTSEDLAAAMGQNLYSVKPRLTELRKGGWVRVLEQRKSKTGAPIDAYVLTTKAEEALRAEARGEPIAKPPEHEQAALIEEAPTYNPPPAPMEAT